MTEVWTGRKSQWRPDISGFDSLDNMRSWCAAAAKGDPDLFEPLFMPSEQGHLVRFNCLSADIEWKSLDELPMAEKKALRWDYHQWRGACYREHQVRKEAHRVCGLRITWSSKLNSFRPGACQAVFGTKGRR